MGSEASIWRMAGRATRSPSSWMSAQALVASVFCSGVSLRVSPKDQEPSVWVRGVARSRSGYRSWCPSQAARRDGSASSQEPRSESASAAASAGHPARSPGGRHIPARLGLDWRGGPWRDRPGLEAVSGAASGCPGIVGWATVAGFIGIVGWVGAVDGHSSPPSVGTQFRIRLTLGNGCGPGPVQGSTNRTLLADVVRYGQLVSAGEDGRPRYWLIAAGLREAIESGQYLPGARLPGENDVMRTHGVARGTAGRHSPNSSTGAWLRPARGQGSTCVTSVPSSARVSADWAPRLGHRARQSGAPRPRGVTWSSIR